MDILFMLIWVFATIMMVISIINPSKSIIPFVKESRIKAGLVWLCIGIIFMFLMLIAGNLSNNKDMVSQDDNYYDGTESTDSIENEDDNSIVSDGIQIPDIEIGVINQVYLADKSCTYDDGSYIAINVQSINKYNEYEVNNGNVIQNAVVLEVGSTIDGVKKFIEQKGYIVSYDINGKILDSGDIYTQSGTELPEILFMPENFNDCKYVCIGGLDNPTEIMFILE